MAVGRASIKRAADAGTAKAAVKTTAKTKSSVVKEAVLTPADSEEIQVKFMTGKSNFLKEGAPVRITEELPTHLL